MRGIHRSPVNSPHKGQWRGALIFSLIWASRNGWANNWDAGDLRGLRAHYDVIVMYAYHTTKPACLQSKRVKHISFPKSEYIFPWLLLWKMVYDAHITNQPWYPQKHPMRMITYYRKSWILLWRRSSAATTSVKYGCDLKILTCAFAISKIFFTEKLTNGALVTSTTGIDLILPQHSGLNINRVFQNNNRSKWDARESLATFLTNQYWHLHPFKFMVWWYSLYFLVVVVFSNVSQYQLLIR